MSLKLAVSAGETSGDRLAASVIDRLTRARPGLAAAGVTGPGLARLGVESLAGLDALDVMGLFEVIRHVPRLARLRRRLVREMLERRVDAFVGFDAPDFNLGLARRLRRGGVTTIQVVAPAVWAWRGYRVGKVARAVDLLLTLFPFEPGYFRAAGLDTRFIGHPLADEMPQRPDRDAARAALGLDGSRPVIALLPGSRPGEIARHARLLMQLVERLANPREIRPMLLLAAEAHRECFVTAAGREPADVGVEVFAGRTREGLAAADVAIVASGTATLEALLSHTPMVAYYRLAPATYHTIRVLRLVKSRWISLPNLLAGQALVPERIQQAASPDILAADVRAWLDDAPRRRRFVERAEGIHADLARGAAERAAGLILERVDDAR